MNFPIFASFVIFVIWLGIQLNRVTKRDAKTEKSFWELEREANNTRRKSLDDLDYIKLPASDFPWDTLDRHESLSGIAAAIHDLSEQKMVNFTGFTNTELKLRYGASNINELIEYDQHFNTFIMALNDWAEILLTGSVSEKLKPVIPDKKAPVISIVPQKRTIPAKVLLSGEEKLIAEAKALLPEELLEELPDSKIADDSVNVPNSEPENGSDSACLTHQNHETFLPHTAPFSPSAEDYAAAKQILEFAVSIHTDISKSYELLANIYLREQTPEKIEALKTTADALPSLTRNYILRLLETMLS